MTAQKLVSPSGGVVVFYGLTGDELALDLRVDTSGGATSAAESLVALDVLAGLIRSEFGITEPGQ